jgi:cation diffusion facilitator family transporter
MEIGNAEKNRRKSNVAMLSVLSNVSLMMLKLVAGLWIGSVSVMSEAIHSGMDLLAAVIAFFAVRKSGKPADKNHPFGHGKVENISGTVEAILIFIAAGWIIFEAIKKLKNPEPMDQAWIGIAVMLISVAANIFVSRSLFKVGKETDSVALMADAWHLRTDVYTSVGVFVGLAVVLAGGIVLPGVDLRWVDPLAAVGVAILIIRAAYHLTVESARDLVDVGLPAEELTEVEKHIRAFAPTIRGFHHLCTRKAGSCRFVEFHIRVDASMSVDESHRIADMITCSIKQHFPGTAVTIHIEPCNCAMSKDRSCCCLLSENERTEMITKILRQDGPQAN